MVKENGSRCWMTVGGSSCHLLYALALSLSLSLAHMHTPPAAPTGEVPMPLGKSQLSPEPFFPVSPWSYGTIGGVASKKNPLSWWGSLCIPGGQRHCHLSSSPPPLSWGIAGASAGGNHGSLAAEKLIKLFRLEGRETCRSFALTFHERF